jgi:hypothetical protein
MAVKLEAGMKLSGLSTDTKPAPADYAVGTIFVETDTNRIYINDGTAWVEIREFPGVRREVLMKFTDPKILIATSSMKLLLTSADIVEAVAGNITSTSQELTIVGGSATAAGNSWIYWNLPKATTKVYVRALVADESGGYTTLNLCDADASTLVNPPDYYSITIKTDNVAEDFLLAKNVAGTDTVIATEAVDLVSLQYYEVECYFEGDGTGNWVIKAWRDEELKFNLSHSEAGIPSIASVRFRKYDSSTTAALKGLIKGQVVIIYE